MKKNSSGMCINSTKRIIKEVNISICIESTCQLDPLLLSSAQVKPSLSYLCEVTVSKIIYVLIQRTHFNSCIISSSFHRLPIEDVISNGTTLDPRCLRHISDGPRDLYLFHKVIISEQTYINKERERDSWWMVCLQFQKL